MIFTVDDPASGRTLATLESASPADVSSTILAARAAQLGWAARPLEDRATIVRQLRSELQRDADAMAQILIEETGKTLTEAHAMEILPLLEACDLWAGRAGSILADTPLKSRVAPHKRSRVRRVARGVVGLICPWNFPLAIGGSEAVMALLAGNAVIVKPSPHAPLALSRWVDLAHRAGVPKDILVVVNGGPETGRAFYDFDYDDDVDDDDDRAKRQGPHAAVDFVAFTGSTEVGRVVASRCGARLIPCRVELGGKAVAVVLPDANLTRAAEAVVWGAFCHSGQVCAGVQRVFVAESVAKEFEQKVVDVLARRTHLPADAPDNEVGWIRLSTTSALVAALASDAIAKGARLLYGAIPTKDERRGRAVVVTDVPADARILSEECFGPLLSISSARNDDGLIAAANASPFGLMGSVFSENKTRARECAEALEIATVMINDVVWAYGMPEAPWFGRKNSGLGASHGDEGMRELTTMQVVHEERTRMLEREPFWYPYSAARLRALRVGTAMLYGAAEVRDIVRGVVQDTVRGGMREGFARLRRGGRPENHDPKRSGEDE